MIFEKINKTDKPSARLTKRKERRYILANSKMKKTALWLLQKYKGIIKEWCHQFYATILGKLDEIN